MSNLKKIYPLQLLEWIIKIILEIQKVKKTTKTYPPKYQKPKWWKILTK